MISIIIPMYNVEDKIERTLSCIENQEIKEQLQEEKQEENKEQIEE